ncbi:MAG TPA: DivIVA domain-containing protein [Erysipelothrix sp.]|nr:DivIVA domain-containing protein [Erysipelothrix sp.]
MSKKLTIEEILETQFKIDFNGYSAQEVDAFLDRIMLDYQEFQRIIDEQKELLARYETTLDRQKNVIQELHNKNRATEDIEPQPNYVDLLKRIALLEEKVFSKD